MHIERRRDKLRVQQARSMRQTPSDAQENFATMFKQEKGDKKKKCHRRKHIDEYA